MYYSHKHTSHLTHKFTAILMILFVTSPLLAQDQDRKERGKQRMLRILERHPKADLNNDGELTREEFRQYRQDNPDLFQNHRGERERQGNNDRQQKFRHTARQAKPTIKDIIYSEESKLTLDFWQTEAEENSPAIILIRTVHAKNQRQGLDRRMINIAKKNGMSFIAVNVGKIKDNMPQAHKNTVLALKFIQAKASEWKIDASKLAVYGNRAHASITLNLASQHNDLIAAAACLNLKGEEKALEVISENSSPLYFANMYHRKPHQRGHRGNKKDRTEQPETKELTNNEKPTDQKKPRRLSNDFFKKLDEMNINYLRHQKGNKPGNPTIGMLNFFRSEFKMDPIKFERKHRKNRSKDKKEKEA